MIFTEPRSQKSLVINGRATNVRHQKRPGCLAFNCIMLEISISNFYSTCQIYIKRTTKYFACILKKIYYVVSRKYFLSVKCKESINSLHEEEMLLNQKQLVPAKQHYSNYTMLQFKFPSYFGLKFFRNRSAFSLLLGGGGEPCNGLESHSGGRVEVQCTKHTV